MVGGRARKNVLPPDRTSGAMMAQKGLMSEDRPELMPALRLPRGQPEDRATRGSWRKGADGIGVRRGGYRLPALIDEPGQGVRGIAIGWKLGA